mmetsp:Transcript_18384/g.19003  ORF Transcript_18384/g.19003 Transcript_18384/m.19003 type:complete len:131 (+) Transcript_18384:30-422(+)
MGILNKEVTSKKLDLNLRALIFAGQLSVITLLLATFLDISLPSKIIFVFISKVLFLKIFMSSIAIIGNKARNYLTLIAVFSIAFLSLMILVKLKENNMMNKISSTLENSNELFDEDPNSKSKSKPKKLGF